MRSRDIRAQRAIKQRQRSKPDQETSIPWDAIAAEQARRQAQQPQPTKGPQ